MSTERDFSLNFDDIENDVREARRAIEREADRELPLPEFLYHVTKKSNVRRIMQEGLRPSALYDSRFDSAVSLSDDIPFAKEVVGITQEANTGSMAVLKINTQYLAEGRTRNHLKRADPQNPDRTKRFAIHEVHYEGDIPPEAIEVVKE